ncbi:uncharacterized protein K452DRAFT_317095 [Aplosporella prunicola CBS 121167]|uniref:DNA polymerase delta subunit 3 n=1 Tax=Aplosporella prunicola CBS 121167 TaxID=1176127 RepID=A0A6A6BM52_9PEZI|nr:uncharacterized protein K452DRAFT_317095 [Aplosporella prunicola CBS 121167]KAF2143621.1 hypothetical protein K452DRAFT_317095 [Aplosporella prunicola CBS 121167]
MDKYRDYLATNVLHDGRAISYRLLSRALKVQVNLAKHMLSDFYSTQNAKKPQSIHATYLVTGTKRPEPAAHTNGTNHGANEDVHMQSSPYQSLAPEQDEEQSIKTTSITLVKEEDLEELKAKYSEIMSIHIYSLEPGPLQSLHALSDCNREIVSNYSTEDPLEAWKTYGTIQNPHVKRRTGGKRAAPAATTAAAKSAPRASIPAQAKPKELENTLKRSRDLKKDSRDATPQANNAAVPKKKSDAKAPTLAREGSNIFKSFAKAKPKKTPTVSESTTPAAESVEPSAAEDEPMKDASDEEGEDEDLMITEPTTKTKQRSEAASKAASEAKARRDALEKMMDDDDSPMADAPAPAVEKPTEEEEEASPIDQPPPPPAADDKKEATVTVSGGRRRGRRRFMKKKTVKDEEGYLVTREEAVWESFSEDEPEPKKLKTVSAPAAKGKKGAAAPKGQGSIMSFFAKK